MLQYINSGFINIMLISKYYHHLIAKNKNYIQKLNLIIHNKTFINSCDFDDLSNVIKYSTYTDLLRLLYSTIKYEQKYLELIQLLIDYDHVNSNSMYLILNDKYILERCINKVKLDKEEIFRQIVSMDYNCVEILFKNKIIDLDDITFIPILTHIFFDTYVIII